jgi:hypothetical protein
VNNPGHRYVDLGRYRREAVPVSTPQRRRTRLLVIAAAIVAAVAVSAAGTAYASADSGDTLPPRRGNTVQR